jgi:hypothetical protein
MKLVLHQMVNAGLAIHPAYGPCTIGTFHSEPIPLRVMFCGPERRNRSSLPMPRGLRHALQNFANTSAPILSSVQQIDHHRIREAGTGIRT